MKLIIVDFVFLGGSLWAWEFHPMKVRICMSQPYEIQTLSLWIDRIRCAELSEAGKLWDSEFCMTQSLPEGFWPRRIIDIIIDITIIVIISIIIIITCIVIAIIISRQK